MPRFLAAALLAISLAACKKEAAKEAEPVIPVQVEDVQRGPIRRIINAEGIVHPKDQASIVPKISAPVRKFYVNRGDHVQANQLLATLENRDLTAAVADTKGALDQAVSASRMTAAATVPDEMVKAQADVQAAKQSTEAAQKLLQSREQLNKDGALARRLVDEAAVAYALAKGQLDTAQRHLESVQSVSRLESVKGAEAQAASAKGKYEAAQAQLSYSEVRSPIAGVITERPLYAGEMASTGAPLLTIMDVSRIIARVSVPVAQAAFIRVGFPATIQQSDADIQTSGKVTVVSAAVDPNSTTVEIWVEAANPGERLRPGAAVHVAIATETVANAILVPDDAILPSASGGSAVLVVGPDSAVHEHKVEIGAREAGKVQILKGAQAGDKVVAVGGLGLADGAKVRIRKPGEKDEDDKKDEDKKDDGKKGGAK